MTRFASGGVVVVEVIGEGPPRRGEEAAPAAAAVFVRSGVDASIREAAGAGVGPVTLDRRFPTRAGSIAAMVRHAIDARADAADALADVEPPEAALAAWLARHTRLLATKRGLAFARHPGDRFEPAPAMLLRVARAARAIGPLAVARGGDAPAHLDRMVAPLFDGLRFRAAPAR